MDARMMKDLAEHAVLKSREMDRLISPSSPTADTNPRY
jgi:hypothetical protein